MSVLIIFLALFIVDSVSANDINETQTLSLPSDVSDDGNILSVENTNESDDSSADNNRNLLGESNGNSNDLLGADTGTFSELQTKIDNARSLDTITLDRDYEGSGTYITVNKPITIDGNGHTLDAKSLSAVMSVTYDKVTLKNLNIINGKQASGGGIYIAKSDIVIDNCTFINDVCTGYGGAIATDGNNLKVTNSKFYSCKSTSTTTNTGGGAIFFREKAVGTGTSNNLNAGTVSGCYFEDCTSGNSGGAISAYCNNVNIFNSTFVLCSVSGTGDSYKSHSLGGAILIINSNNANITYCKFFNCTSQSKQNNIRNGGMGGALALINSNYFFVDKCSFLYCNSTYFGGSLFFDGNYGVISNSDASNGYSQRGGVFCCCGDYCQMINCTGTDNWAEHGSVTYSNNIFVSSSGDHFIKNFRIINSSFYNNYASVNEAALCLHSNNCLIYNCVFVNNTSTNDIIMVNGKGNNISNSLIYDNHYARAVVSIADSTTNSFYCDNNWFGNTEDNFDDKPVTYGNVILNKWYFLTLVANQTVVAQNQTVLMEIGLNGLYDSKTGKTSKSSHYNLPFDMLPETYLPAEFGIGTDNGVTNQSSIVFSHKTDSFLYTPENTDSGSVFLNNVQGMYLSDSVIVIKNGTFTDLYNRINYTDENGTLNLPYNFTYDEDYDNQWLNNLYGLSEIGGGLPVDKNITINGNDNTIDALNKVDIFNITDELVLENVKLKDGTINNNGDLTLKNVEQTGTPYSVINNGNLVLEKEYNLGTIKNNGLITGLFTITVMNNQTVILQIDDRVTDINATTDFGVDIEGGKLSFILCIFLKFY